MASLDDVYRKFGEVSEAAQLLETELGNLLLSHTAHDEDLFANPDPATARKLLDRINRSTMGAVLHKVAVRDARMKAATEVLEEALAERNRLIHSFFREHNFRRNSEAGCSVMLQDLGTIHQAILAAYKLLLLLSGVDIDLISLQRSPTVHLKLD